MQRAGKEISDLGDIVRIIQGYCLMAFKYTMFPISMQRAGKKYQILHEYGKHCKLKGYKAIALHDPYNVPQLKVNLVNLLET
jgi:hypothetical protein